MNARYGLWVSRCSLRWRMRRGRVIAVLRRNEFCLVGLWHRSAKGVSGRSKGTGRNKSNSPHAEACRTSSQIEPTGHFAHRVRSGPAEPALTAAVFYRRGGRGGVVGTADLSGLGGRPCVPRRLLFAAVLHLPAGRVIPPTASRIEGPPSPVGFGIEPVASSGISINPGCSDCSGAPLPPWPR